MWKYYCCLTQRVLDQKYGFVFLFVLKKVVFVLKTVKKSYRKIVVLVLIKLSSIYLSDTKHLQILI